MPKILYTKGAPASGKSFEAKQLVNQGWVRVNKDELRALLHNGKHSEAKEELVLAAQDALIEEALKAGKNVVVDNTGFHNEHEKRIRKIAAKYNAAFDVKFYDTDKATCLARNKARAVEMAECKHCSDRYVVVPDEAIEFMFKRYINNPKYKMVNPLTAEEYTAEMMYQHQDGLPWAIMVDMDGTLAHMKGRSPYEWKRCIEDELDHSVAEVLKAMHAVMEDDRFRKFQIIIMSGRDAVCRAETEQWLANFHLPWGIMCMRPENDKRKDSEVKKELFDTYIRNKYNIAFVLDDRKQVVDMWRGIGLTCFQVAPGDF